MKKQNLFSFFLLLLFFLVTHSAWCQTVYVTEKGAKFHKKNCSVVKEGKKGLELSEAKKQGYMPCAVCKPDAGTALPASQKISGNGKNRK